MSMVKKRLYKNHRCRYESRHCRGGINMPEIIPFEPDPVSTGEGS